ncbi:hypothetical protein ACFQBU_19080, partial [Jhaorihella thermophila]
MNTDEGSQFAAFGPGLTRLRRSCVRVSMDVARAGSSTTSSSTALEPEMRMRLPARMRPDQRPGP